LVLPEACRVEPHVEASFLQSDLQGRRSVERGFFRVIQPQNGDAPEAVQNGRARQIRRDVRRATILEFLSKAVVITGWSFDQATRHTWSQLTGIIKAHDRLEAERQLMALNIQSAVASGMAGDSRPAKDLGNQLLDRVRNE
jgi:hypothetical protein